MSREKILGLFVLTALCELTGCYLVYWWLKRDGSAWLLVPTVLSLSLFAWLLTLHPTGAGRTYAAYGGVYVAVSVGWMWAIEQQRPDGWDLIGAAISLIGMSIIAFAPHNLR